MEKGTTYVGLDAHQVSTNGAIILPTGEILEDRFATTPEGVRRWVRRLKRRFTSVITSIRPLMITSMRPLKGQLSR